MLLAYDLYGTHLEGMVAIKSAVEAALQCVLTERDSEFQGTYLLAELDNQASVSVKLNEDPYDHKPIEKDFLQERVLISIDDTAHSSEIRARLEGTGHFYLLRHEEF